MSTSADSPDTDSRTPSPEEAPTVTPGRHKPKSGHAPSCIRTTEQGWAALCLLKRRHPKKSLQQLVTDALVHEVDGTRASPDVKFNTLAADTLLLLRADLAESESHYDQIHRDLLEVFKKPTPDQAEKAGEILEKIDCHVKACRETDNAFRLNARLANALTENPDIESLRATKIALQEMAPTTQNMTLRRGFEILACILP